MPPWLRYQRLERYRWATAHAQGARIVDAACSNGYGSQMLLHAGARRVVGIDLSLARLASARHRPEAGLHWIRGNGERLPLAPSGCDVFVSLETIEHIPNDDAFVSEVRRVLRPGGLFLCSTPNRRLTLPGSAADHRPLNVYHIREYTRGELEAVLRRHFQTVEMWGQTAFSAGYRKHLERWGGRSPRIAARRHQVRKLLGWLAERPERHRPWKLTDEDPREPEVLLARCS